MRSEVKGPGRVVCEKAVAAHAVHVPDNVGVDLETETGQVDGGRKHVCPGQLAVLVVDVLKPTYFAWDATIAS
jgi:hypothetical protein